MHNRTRLAFISAAIITVLLLTILIGCASPMSSNLASSDSSPSEKGSSYPTAAATSGNNISTEPKASTKAPTGASSQPNVSPDTKASQSTKDTAAANAALVLSVTEPEDELEMDGPQVIVAGKSIPGAVVSVDDTITIADRQGSFSVTLHVVESPYSIEIVASDRDGNQVSEIRTVFLK